MTDPQVNQPPPQFVSPTEVVVERMKEIRLARGWSVHTLVERLADIGRVDITENSIWNIQIGRSRLSLDFVFAIAAALEVSPSALLSVRPDSDVIVEVLPGVQVSAHRFNAWVSAVQPLPGGNDEIFASHHPYGSAISRIQGGLDQRAQALAARMSTEPTSTEEIATTLTSEVEQLATELAELSRQGDTDHRQRQAIDAVHRRLGLLREQSRQDE